MGKCRGKFSILLLYEAVSATVSLQDSWVGKEEWRRRKWLPAISTQLQHVEVWIIIFKAFLFGDTKYELYTTYVSGKYWENKFPLLGAEFYQNSADQFRASPDARVRRSLSSSTPLLSFQEKLLLSNLINLAFCDDCNNKWCSREGFSAAQVATFLTKTVFVQVISLLLHFALLYFPLKIMFHVAPVLLHFEFKSCYTLGKKLLQFAFICVKSYNAA